MGIPQEKITMEASFADDFGFNDFQFTCLAFYIGLYFKINIREREYAELDTIGNVINFVSRKLDNNKYCNCS